MSLPLIDRGTGQSDASGDDAHVWSGKSNDWFLYLEALITSSQHEVIIQGAYVITLGKTDLTQFEEGDKFRAWYGNRYVVGKIENLPVTLPQDLDNGTKVKLAQNDSI